MFAAVLPATFILYHFRSPLSRGFAKLFLSFLHNPFDRTLMRCRLLDSPVIISLLPPPCQYLFAIFFLLSFRFSPPLIIFHQKKGYLSPISPFLHSSNSFFKPLVRQIPVCMRTQNLPIVVHIPHIFPASLLHRTVQCILYFIIKRRSPVLIPRQLICQK